MEILKENSLIMRGSVLNFGFRNRNPNI